MSGDTRDTREQPGTYELRMTFAALVPASVVTYLDGKLRELTFDQYRIDGLSVEGDVLIVRYTVT